MEKQLQLDVAKILVLLDKIKKKNSDEIKSVTDSYGKMGSVFTLRSPVSLSIVVLGGRSAFLF